MTRARTLMVQGTASSVGKSLLVTALCRLFRQEGLRVAPFKAQNMALNAAVTADGLEIGRAQAVQAEAAGLEPTVDMNPILIKPEADARAQVVLMGRPAGSFGALDYHRRKPELRALVAGALDRLRAAHDLVVIEGAGSPAEVNLRDRDLVNMAVAHMADAPVLLVGDIDRGGVLAAFVGTMELLEPDDRARVAAFVVNKFRGDLRLLAPALEFLERRGGRPVLGVLPHLSDLHLPDEDSLSLDLRRGATPAGELVVAVARYPRLANHDDLLPLEREPGVAVRWVERASEAEGADLLVLPGSKSVVADLAWLRERGLAAVAAMRAARGEPVLGICGGCEMLGELIEDPEGVESPRPVTAGLCLLPLRTRFGAAKLTARVRARPAAASWLAAGEARGYEIHMGQVIRTGGAAAFTIIERSGAAALADDGAVAGAVAGTMIHGLLEDAAVRGRLLEALRARRGLPGAAAGASSAQASYDRLAEALRAHLDLGRLRALVS